MPDICAVNKLTYHHQELKIRDHATAHAYHFGEAMSTEFTSDPSQICLYLVRQGRIKLHASYIPHPLELGPNDAIFLAFPRGNW